MRVLSLITTIIPIIFSFLLFIMKTFSLSLLLPFVFLFLLFDLIIFILIFNALCSHNKVLHTSNIAALQLILNKLESIIRHGIFLYSFSSCRRIIISTHIFRLRYFLMVIIAVIRAIIAKLIRHNLYGICFNCYGLHCWDFSKLIIWVIAYSNTLSFSIHIQ